MKTPHQSIILTIALIAIGFVHRSYSDILYQYTANADPTSLSGGNWTDAVSAGTGVTGIIDAAFNNTPAWRVSNHFPGDTGYYSVIPTAAEINMGKAHGWSLKACLRVTSANRDAGGSMLCLYRAGGTSWQMHFGSDAAGNAIVVLSDGLSNTTGNSYTVPATAGTGYNTFELIYSPAKNSADLFVNGVVQMINYLGFPTSFPDEIAWGDGSTQLPSKNTSAANYCGISFAVCGRASVTKVALRGDQAPNTAAKWNTFFPPAVNPAGHNAFLATLMGVGVTTSNNRGIWAGLNLPLVVRTDDATPCVPGGKFKDLSSPAFNDLDQVAFRGVLRPGGFPPAPVVTSANAAGIWTNSAPGNLLTLIAREGVASPECGFPPCVQIGARYSQNGISSLAMPDGGGVVFLGRLVNDATVGINNSNNVGLWRSDADAVVDLILRKGDIMSVNNVNETVKSFTVLSPAMYVAGAGRSLERPTGRITCRIVFVSNVTGVFNLD